MLNINKDELLISALFDTQPECVFWMKPIYSYNRAGEITDFEICYSNPAGARLMNMSQQEIMGKWLKKDKVLGGISEQMAFEQSLKVFEEGTSENVTYYNPALQKNFYVTRTKVKDGVLNIARDITYEIAEAKKARADAERSAEKLRTFINNVQSGMSYLLPVRNETGEIIDFSFDITNAAFAAYSATDPEAITGDLVSKRLPSYINNGLFGQFKRTYLSGETARFETHYKDERLDIWFNVLATKMEDGVLATTTDMTTVKKLQIKLESSVKELKKSNANLQEFAYVASHDLQEPLRKIQVFADRLKKDVTSLSEENQNVFERMISATKRMTQLINDLLAYSQLSMKPSEFKTVDLKEIVQQVLVDLEAAITEKGASISLENLPEIKGDAVQLRQLFQNLVSNSLKYSSHSVKPLVLIRSKLIKKEVNGTDRPFQRIEVIDNGIGFEQQNVERIFKVFQRLHGRSEYPGTGIGLAIVAKVVENHRGSITAESEPEKGATFIVDLPA